MGLSYYETIRLLFEKQRYEDIGIVDGKIHVEDYEFKIPAEAKIGQNIYLGERGELSTTPGKREAYKVGCLMGRDTFRLDPSCLLHTHRDAIDHIDVTITVDRDEDGQTEFEKAMEKLSDD
jgi:hypothetical protein